MIEILDEKIFHLYNEKISYIFYVMENQQLGHLYYGGALGAITADELGYFLERENKSAGTVKFSADSGMFTLADRSQEYPVYGTSDFKEGALDIQAADELWYLDFKYVGYEQVAEKKRTLDRPASYACSGEAETLIIHMADTDHHLELVLSFSIFADSSAIVRSQVLKNKGSQVIQLNKMLSGVLELPSADYEFIHLSGAWLKERHIKRRSLEQGTVSIGSLKGASGHQHNPFTALAHKQATLNDGVVYGTNLIYSGNFLVQVEVDEWQRTRLMTGIHPTHFNWQLGHEEVFQTPEAVLFYSGEGLNGLANEAARFAEKHVIDRKWMRKLRPIVFNNWEATYFEFDQEKLTTLAKAGKDLGMECFVLDDGWFGRRDDDRSSLGDWFVDERKFPNGIKVFAEQIHQMGLQLGIWFEPEMVSPKSQLYEAHPEWVVRHPYERTAIGRGQYVLDFSNPEVVEAIYAQLKKIIEETQLEYIKWDMNRNITEAYSTYLKAVGRPQTEFFHRYILGVYHLYECILTDFPDILIEGCAGGGGRYDLGILFYSPQIWPSDNSDAVERLAIQSGTLLGYPLSSFSNHVSTSPNHQIDRHTSLQMRQDVCLFGPLGYELDITKLDDEEKRAIQANIQFYKAHRDLLTHGTFFQLLPIGDTENEVAWAVCNQDRSEWLIGFYRKLAQANPPNVEYLKIPMMDQAKTYLINGAAQVTGGMLKEIGLKKPYVFNGVNHEQMQVSGDFQSAIYHLKEIR
ncbi:alpha-galactosidase [Listeria costaricensis]|uniref:alpha-galactosidase n=1 Tax=Listeria costaricensis TaxID=2026604 RepID=UPI000C06912C|nr:alpha-galactosidase [Listeria costaricensis]